MNINYNEVVKIKIRRLQELCDRKIWPNYSHNKSTPADEELKEYYDKRIKFVQESGVKRTQEMIEKIQSLGYEITHCRVSSKGVLSIVASRNGYKLFGFATPTGKLILSNEKRENVLVVNYQKKSMRTHDKFLEVVVREI